MCETISPLANSYSMLKPMGSQSVINNKAVPKKAGIYAAVWNILHIIMKDSCSYHFLVLP
ncbi:TPA: hypothetical protein RTH44_001718 [Campylobacter jejuni]|nr:hypothetical protein [Campylobacter jejuni]HDZ5111129.1 hypothetical protein [Campylobacter jejuni]HDZ5141888.1 hypothetical protein [Campylobacter jejuni]HDZ5142469.1 hypothetical protein [Campylobacter jejuni]